MEQENKQFKQQGAAENTQGGHGGNFQGGRHRRKKKKGGNGGQGQNVQNTQNAQNQQNAQGNNANVQKQQPQKQNQPQNKQNQQNPSKQNGQNKQNQQGGNQQKNKNQGKPNGQNVKQQNQPKNQNVGGRDKTNDKNDRNDRNKKEENRKDTYLYTLDGNLYVNLTNKCCNGCDFCVRNERSSYYGNYLWLKNGDPTVEKVISAAKGFGDLTRFKEVVFCGFGEPTYKVAEMVALCDYFHEKGLKTRLNTNGQGNLVNKRDIVPDLKGKIDFVNISLNASCYEKYQPICRSQFGEVGFAGMIEFAKLCRRNGVDCRFSIVDCIGEEEVAACKCLADSLKIPLYVRKYITDS